MAIGIGSEPLAAFLRTVPNDKRPNARRTLTAAVTCADGVWPRHLVLERLIAAGARLVDRASLAPIALDASPSSTAMLEVGPGALLDRRDTTPTGLLYAAFLLVQRSACEPESSSPPDPA